MTQVNKTYEEINEKIKNGIAVVVTAEEMISIVEEKGEIVAAKEVDVVTTGTFGCMCSSGAMLNWGHCDPPIKPEHVWLNDVHTYHGNAAADGYIGATRMASPRNFEYGGGHVIEDLLRGKTIKMVATGYGTDCYPRKHLETEFTLDDLNQAYLLNPRNAYQRYNCAVNASNKTIYTYMGKLLPNLGNATYAGAGAISPLNNDPDFETIGVGTHIFLAGGDGIITAEGTQHSPESNFGTLMVQGDMKTMSPEFLAGASIKGYGTSMFVGLGIPIPILNERIAKNCGIKDEDIPVDVVDYSTGTLNRPTLMQTNYKQMKSGKVEVNGKILKVSSMSSLYKARKIADLLKERIQKGEFLLYKPVRQLSSTTTFNPIPEKEKIKFVSDYTIPAETVHIDTDVVKVADKFIEKDINQIIVVDDDMKLKGFLSTFDLAKSVKNPNLKLKDIMVPKDKLMVVKQHQIIEDAKKIIKKMNISSLPVIDANNKIAGILLAENLIEHKEDN